MPRPENPKQTIQEFELLGHKAEIRRIPARPLISPNGFVIECLNSGCRCWLGAPFACNPCGDPLGRTLTEYTEVVGYEYRGQKLE